ncbi:hypothetical protein GF362_00080 [Candidatus Dojkabacteria bacterium]|nr:hypothetical protein [Candidatus Dojkabacteria bacterium]
MKNNIKTENFYIAVGLIAQNFSLIGIIPRESFCGNIYIFRKESDIEEAIEDIRNGKDRVSMRDVYNARNYLVGAIQTRRFQQQVEQELLLKDE